MGVSQEGPSSVVGGGGGGTQSSLGCNSRGHPLRTFETKMAARNDKRFFPTIFWENKGLWKV